MNLVERLRTHLKDYGAAIEAADRIEALEAALRKIMSGTGSYYEIARTALAEKQDK